MLVLGFQSYIHLVLDTASKLRIINRIHHLLIKTVALFRNHVPSHTINPDLRYKACSWSFHIPDYILFRIAWLQIFPPVDCFQNFKQFLYYISSPGTQEKEPGMAKQATHHKATTSNNSMQEAEKVTGIQGRI